MEKKITKKEMFGEVIKVANELGRNDIVEFANHEIELLDKKAQSKGETAKQKENANIKDIVLATLEKLNTKVTVTELLQNDEINEKVNGSNQKLTALLTQLKKDNKITNIKEGKKSYYQAI